jgi:hypothetical protein
VLGAQSLRISQEVSATRAHPWQAECTQPVRARAALNETLLQPPLVGRPASVGQVGAPGAFVPRRTDWSRHLPRQTEASEQALKRCPRRRRLFAVHAPRIARVRPDPRPGASQGLRANSKGQNDEGSQRRPATCSCRTASRPPTRFGQLKR